VGASAPGTPVWRSLHCILSTRGGTAADHAVLLASLFLGFGLDAYVCIGLGVARGSSGGSSGSSSGSGGGASLGAVEEEAVWVLTRVPAPPPPQQPLQQQHSQPPQRYTVTLHDPLTGLQHAPTSPTCPFRRLHCLFSQAAFYACTAGDDTLGSIAGVHGFDFEDPCGSAWKGMERGIVGALPRGVAPPLAPTSLNAVAVAVALEGALMEAWEAWREEGGCAFRCRAARRALAEAAGRPELDARVGSVVGGRGGGGGVVAVDAAALPWSDRFSFLLTQALTAYEQVRVASGHAGGAPAAEHCIFFFLHLCVCFCGSQHLTPPPPNPPPTPLYTPSL
jgi:hypothetical protein